MSPALKSTVAEPDQLSALEERVTMAVELIARLKAERDEAVSTVARLESERKDVRTRIERLLSQIDLLSSEA